MEALFIIGVIIAAWITTMYAIGWISANFPRVQPVNDFDLWDKEIVTLEDIVLAEYRLSK